MFFCWRWLCVCVFGHKCNGLHADFYERDGRKCERGWRRRRKKGKSHIRESRWSWWRLPCLFVCVCRVQWSHQEASSVCEAILSQRIPSPICKHTPSLLPLPFRRSEHPPLWIPRNLICHCSAKKKKQPKKTFPSYYLSLKMFHSLPLLPSCRKPCPNATGHNPADLLLTPAWPFVG